MAVLDLDAHHCDGVQDAFYERNDVLTVSLHESGRTLFPGTGFAAEIGVGPGTGFCVNVPFPMGVDDDIYMKAFTELVMPLLDAFSPDVLVLELGADALDGDLLGHLALTNNSYTDIIAMVRRLQRPILATGGGGYSLEQTVRAWALAWVALCWSILATKQHFALDIVAGGFLGALAYAFSRPGLGQSAGPAEGSLRR